jgi:predicted transcriptional regulator
MKKRLVLGERDIGVLNALHLHGALNMRQLAQLCFGEVSSETARKRLRKLHPAGYIGASVANNKEEKGRPEHLYFLAAPAATALARSQDMPEQAIVIGPPNTNHKDHLTRLVDLHLAWQQTAKQEKIAEFKFLTKRVAASMTNGNEHLNNATGHADAVITFKRAAEDTQTILLVLETGNLRRARHWEPKINAFLKTNTPVLVVSLDEKRLNTLREWTMPMLKAVGMKEERYIFSLDDDIVMKGFRSSMEHCTKGSIIKIPVLSK